MAMANATFDVKVSIKSLPDGREALNLSVIYGDRSAEVSIALKQQDVTIRDDQFVRSEVFQLGAALQAMAKSHGT